MAAVAVAAHDQRRWLRSAVPSGGGCNAPRLVQMTSGDGRRNAPQAGARHALRGTGLYWSLFVAFVIAVAVLIGIIQNQQTVELKYLGWDLRTPLVVILLVTVLAAFLFAALVGVTWRHRRRGRLADREELQELRHRADEPVTAPSAVSHDYEPPSPPPAEPPIVRAPLSE